MPKTLILYRSPHHGNTKKLLDAIVAAHPDVVLAQAGEDAFDASQYDRIGIASGVYMGKPHRTLRKALEGIIGGRRKAFAVYTCGDPAGGKYGESFLALLSSKGFAPDGLYWSVGWDSFGPLRLMGGVNKGRPNAEEIRGAVAFYEGLND
jgi:hypothetical protein